MRQMEEEKLRERSSPGKSHIPLMKSHTLQIQTGLSSSTHNNRQLSPAASSMEVIEEDDDHAEEGKDDN